MSEDFLLTPDEVCALLAIGRSTLWTMLKRGEIQSITIGKLRRIPRAALDVWLQERLEASAQPQAVTDTVTDTSTAPRDGPGLETAPAVVADTVTVTGQALEPFDTAKYVLGKLCPRNHDYHGTGQSLLRRTNRHCCACDREKFQERGKVQRQTRRQAKRQATAL